MKHSWSDMFVENKITGKIDFVPNDRCIVRFKRTDETLGVAVGIDPNIQVLDGVQYLVVKPFPFKGADVEPEIIELSTIYYAKATPALGKLLKQIQKAHADAA